MVEMGFLMERRIMKNSFPFFAALGAFLLTILATYFTFGSLKERQRIFIKSITFQIEQKTISHMQTNLNVLLQTRSMFQASNSIERSEFKKYINNLDFLGLFPGIQGVGYTQRIKAQDLEKRIAAVRQEGFPDFEVWPSYKREEYHPIIYLEPFDWRNQRAFGYDMFTDPVRHRAMKGAWDSGKPFMTDPVMLVQETENDIQSGFLIYVPVYRGGKIPETLKERRERLVGFVYSPFRSRNLFHDIFLPFQQLNVELDVFIGAPRTDRRIYSSSSQKHESEEPKFVKDIHIEMAGQTLIARTYFYSNFGSATNYSPFILFIIGSFFSLSLFWVMKKRLKYSLSEIERAKNYEALTRVGKALAAQLNLEKLAQEVVDAGRDLSKGQGGIFFYNKTNDEGEEQLSCAVSGVPKEAFLKFLSQRTDQILSNIFNEKKSIRSPDITSHPGLGESSYFGFTSGTFLIRSYLGVPVISRNGTLLGSLIYGHPDVDVFQEREQTLVEGIASQAAIAIDNAKLLQAANDAIATRDEFLSIASHELKTPITALKLQFQMAQKLIDRGDLSVFEPESIKKRVMLSNFQLDRMSKLVSDMLETSRFTSNKLELIKEEIDINDLVEMVISSMKSLLIAENITLHFNPAPDKVTIFSDKNRMEQVLNNLISNAMKYGEKKPIEVVIRNDPEWVYISVKDHGMGIPQDRIESIFNRFERAISRSNISGLGLGLYITGEIVKAHGGTIDVVSKVGEGSTFTVKLPRLVVK